jgi:hypothetical protein
LVIVVIRPTPATLSDSTGNLMKQRRDINQAWQPGDPDRWRRRVLWLRWPVTLVAGAAITILLMVDALSFGMQLALGLSAASLVLIFMRLVWVAHRRRRSWRYDDSVVEPPLARPVSALVEEREWTIPSHPLIRYPLAFALAGFMYWVLVFHAMRLPAYWLVLLLVLTVISLWCWRQPLGLVLILGIGIALLSAGNWILTNLSIGMIAGLAIFILILAGWLLRIARNYLAKGQQDA